MLVALTSSLDRAVEQVSSAAAGVTMVLEALTDPLLLSLMLAVGLPASLAAFFAGRWLGSRTGREGEERRAVAWMEPVEEDMRDLRKSTWILQNENKNLSTFLMLLPDLARELNTNMEKRLVAPLLRRMIEQIFDPEMILVFFTTQGNDGLVLVEAKGLPLEYNRGKMIPFGEGRVGWVASHQVCMDENDFQQKAKFVMGEFDSKTHPHFRVELAVPIAHKEKTLGVITVGGMLRHPKNEKTMLKMVADLGSIALNNAMLFQRMEQIANSDGLTGLCTKRFFLERLADQILKAEQRHEEFSLFIFDIDHFKNYNDNNGHPAGDDCLKITGRLLRESLRDDDVSARYGGEEFIVLLPGTPKAGAGIVAEKIRHAIESFEYPRETSQPGGDLTISGGVASYPFDGRTTSELIGAADESLYRAKRAGRNRVAIHEPEYLSESEVPADMVIAARSAV